MSKANVNHLAYVGTKPGQRDSDSWYTPIRYLESARKVLKGFDLDPFSSAYANETVKAKRIITEKQDAFKASWEAKTVFMNPPYGRGIAAPACHEFVRNFTEGKFSRGIVLVNNATETKWFQELLTCATAICLTNHRIAFTSPDGKHVSGNTRGQTFFLFESNQRSKKATLTRFEREFSTHGTILKVNN
jgi:phage N-6-adenine-methyltransferase